MRERQDLVGEQRVVAVDVMGAELADEPSDVLFEVDDVAA